jgi:hypothetical protein
MKVPNDFGYPIEVLLRGSSVSTHCVSQIEGRVNQDGLNSVVTPHAERPDEGMNMVGTPVLPDF